MPGIIIAGLGPGDPAFMTRAVWDVISAAPLIYLRTAHHPSVAHFPDSAAVISFDDLYESSASYEEVYVSIIERIISESLHQDILYAVPGDPMVGEATGTGILRAAALQGIPCRVLPGISFMEVCLRELQVDALDGLVLVDALEVNQRFYPPFSPDMPVLISQVYSRMVASDLKLNLMGMYPDDHDVVLLHLAGTGETEVEAVPLYEIDHSRQIGSMTTLYLPPRKEAGSLESFAETIARLRSPDGCPWDREQTHQSLRPHMLEETYEALQALDDDDMEALQEELGDLLLQIVLQAQIASEEEEFSLSDVVAGINRKIVHRHPHVFEANEAGTTDEVLVNWEKIKSEDREGESGLLDGIPRILPALSQAQKIQQRVKRVGFDWSEITGVKQKIQEELTELDEALSLEERKEELGDLLFSIVNLARWLEIDAEDALRETSQKFRMRFHAVEGYLRKQGRMFSGLSPEELDELWEQAKKEFLSRRESSTE